MVNGLTAPAGHANPINSSSTAHLRIARFDPRLRPKSRPRHKYSPFSVAAAPPSRSMAPVLFADHFSDPATLKATINSRSAGPEQRN
jgi:hypothetical protein